MTEIVASFQGVEIFITGGSGVVGRALIEKLLRSCDLKRIYILLRPKRGVSANERLAELRKHKIFRELCLQKPHELEKLVAVPGDIESECLGITPEYAEIVRNVSIFYHCAATVRFDEPLERAINLNIGGTLRALTFAETLKNLRVFMHVSTYYSNPYLAFVEPKIYPPAMDWRVCFKLAQNEPCDGAIRFLTKKITTGFPNTYCFTKHVTESLVEEYQDRLPVAIFRPSIVIFSTEEPVPGFPPSMMGAMGLFLGVGVGIVKTVYMNPIIMDLTPQDCMAKALAYYTNHAASLYMSDKKMDVPVYTASSTKYFKLNLPEMSDIAIKLNLWRYSGYEKSFLIPGCLFTNSRLLYMTIFFSKQLLPALLGDLLLRLFGRKPVMVSIQRRMFTAQEEMRAFMFNKFDSEGYTLEKELFKDTERTPFEVGRTLKGLQYNHKIGLHLMSMAYEVREHLLGEEPATIPKFRRVGEIKMLIYNVILFLLAFFICNRLLNL